MAPLQPQPADTGRFVWPPRPPAEPPPQSQPPPPPPAPPTAWELFEREWIGVTTPPLARRLADAGVQPDPLSAFCWRCARTVGPFETDAKGCSDCRGSRPGWDRFVRLGEYREPWSRFVWDAKFTRWPRLAADLGRVLGRQVAAAVPDLRECPSVVVPVPTNLWRRFARGTDHSLNIARGVGAELGLPVRYLLTRSRRPEQARLSRSDRQENLRNAMRRSPVDAWSSRLGVTAGARWPGKENRARVILVDDISTTGATMREACRATRAISKGLQIQDLEIVAACICRTESDRP